jgi:hypothetical protein
MSAQASKGEWWMGALEILLIGILIGIAIQSGFFILLARVSRN